MSGKAVKNMDAIAPRASRPRMGSWASGMEYLTSSATWPPTWSGRGRLATAATKVSACCSPMPPSKHAACHGLPGGVDHRILVLRRWHEAVAMTLRVWDRMRRNSHELVEVGLDTASFCTETGPLVTRALLP